LRFPPPANRDDQSNADTERARVGASSVIRIGNELQLGMSRALTDGVTSAGSEGCYDSATNGFRCFRVLVVGSSDEGEGTELPLPEEE
jgi:hypothetical protein